MVGSNINITMLNATYLTTTQSSGDTPVALAPNGQQTFTVSGLGTPTAGSSYSISVDIVYDNLDSGLTGFRSTGTLTGVVS